jgi:hypothetical protein
MSKRIRLMAHTLVLAGALFLSAPGSALPSGDCESSGGCTYCWVKCSDGVNYCGLIIMCR